MSDRAICSQLLKEYPIPADPLKEIFRLQKEFGGRFCPFDQLQLPDMQREKLMWWDKFLDCCDSEKNEVRDWTPWKHWKDYSTFEVHPIEIRFELIDILHFVVSLLLVVGETEKCIYESYLLDPNEDDLDDMIGAELKLVMGQHNLDPRILRHKFELTEILIRRMSIHLGLCYNYSPNFLHALLLVKTLVSLFGVWGMNGKDVYNYYVSKNRENIDRQKRGY
jgi:hypothetical protein